MRAKGEGTISRRKDGRYAVAVWHDGRRYWAYAKTQRDAQRALTSLRAALNAQARVREAGLTVAAYCEDWLGDVAGQVSAQTLLTYRGRLERSIIPALGTEPLHALRPADLQALYRALEARGLSPSSVRDVHMTVRMALEAAVRLELLTRNPADRTVRPRRLRTEARALSPTEAERLVAAAKTDELGALWTLAIGTGMRQGEILALRWQDVDLAAARLTVRGTAVAMPGRGMVIGPPKTARSRRGVPLAGFVVAALRRHREQQAPLGLYVFSSPEGTPLRPQAVREQFHAFCEAAGLPRLRFHDLRHSTATLLMGRGVHPSIVAALLGHSSTAMTLDVYSHAGAGIAADAVKALDALFGG